MGFLLGITGISHPKPSSNGVLFFGGFRIKIAASRFPASDFHGSNGVKRHSVLMIS